MSTNRSRSRRRPSGGATNPATSAAAAPPGPPENQAPATPGTTGRYLVLFREGAQESGMRALRQTAGLNVTSTREFGDGAAPADLLASSETVMFDTLGVAVVTAPPDQFRALRTVAAEDGPILAIEEERIVYAFDDPFAHIGIMPVAANPSPSNSVIDYLRGYRAAVNHVTDQLLGASAEGVSPGGPARAAVSDSAEFTWGLQITNADKSTFTGKGVRVAVLDTGMDTGHPDFVGRKVTTRSFVALETAQDGHGHGTHCIGTSCGALQPGQLPRYGIASGAEIYAGKVLSNRGSGSDSGILAGIQWAITNKCAVISMSLGAPTQAGQAFSRIFETVAKRALAAGTLIVAAAGNESSRPALIAPVGHPANCPSIIAVAAIDSQLGIASFSCGGLSGQGGQVDIAGPGVAVRSSWPRPTLYRTISGTSMATPHVAGIAALHAEANPDMRGGALGWLLLQSAMRISLSVRDVGAGLVQAP